MFYQNLQAACDAKGLKLTTIIKECGGASGSIAGWKQGAYPNSHIVVKLAARLNVSTDFLLTGTQNETNKIIDPDTQELFQIFSDLDREGRVIVRAASYYARDRLASRKKSVIEFPVSEIATGESRPLIVYDMPASAGTGLFLDSDDYTVIDFPAADIPLKATFGVRITGDSMSPEILDGDIVLVKQQPAVNENEIGIFLLNGDCYCKRYIKEKERHYLASINPRYDPIKVGEYDELRTVGKVIGAVKE